jgi:YVTN family beta-propeller protein
MDLVGAAGGLIVLSSDNTTGAIERIDPSTGAVTASLDLHQPPNGFLTAQQAAYWDFRDLAVADGSVWVALYFANVVYRLNPVTLHVQATVATGRSPAGVVYGGGSLWAPLNNGRSVDRIDPATNTVAQQVPVGRQRGLSDEPVKAAWDGTSLLVSLTGSGRVAHVSADGRRVWYDTVGAEPLACARILPVPDGYWLDDTDCNGDNSYFHWSSSARAITDMFITPKGFGAVYANGFLYTGGAHCDANFNCSGGLIDKHDSSTGALLTRRHVGPVDAWLPHLALGALWSFDLDNLRLQRSPVF